MFLIYLQNTPERSNSGLRKSFTNSSSRKASLSNDALLWRRQDVISGGIAIIEENISSTMKFVRFLLYLKVFINFEKISRKWQSQQVIIF